jgi:hypothetical protein
VWPRLLSQEAHMDFKELVGKVLGFYGVDGNAFKTGRYVFEAVEDENDGYRSMMRGVAEVKDPSGLIFFKRRVATVRVEEDSEFDGFRLVDVADGHTWLRLGTDHADDYYPMFRFDYEPKKVVTAT